MSMMPLKFYYALARTKEIVDPLLCLSCGQTEQSVNHLLFYPLSP